MGADKTGGVEMIFLKIIIYVLALIGLDTVIRRTYQVVSARKRINNLKKVNQKLTKESR